MFSFTTSGTHLLSSPPFFARVELSLLSLTVKTERQMNLTEPIPILLVKLRLPFFALLAKLKRILGLSEGKTDSLFPEPILSSLAALFAPEPCLQFVKGET